MSSAARIACALFAVVGLWTATARAQPVDRSLPTLRYGAGLGPGFVYPVGAAVVHPNGTSSDVFSAGIGVDLRLGVQLTEWLAADLDGGAESIVLAGDAHAAALLELSPAPPFAFAAGIAAGSLYDLNFFWPNPSASYWSAIARPEVRIRQQAHAGRVQDYTIALEGQLGRTIAGDPPKGNLVVGARALFGLLWH